MDIQNRITPLIASLESTLTHCITALKNGGDVVQVMSALATTQQALSKLRPLIDTLVQIEDEQSTALFGIQDAAIELLLSLDSTQPSYTPRPHDENIDLIHSILEWYHDAPPPDNVVKLPVKKELH